MIEAHFDELEAMTSTSAACDLLGVVAGDALSAAATASGRVRRHPGRPHRTS